MAFILKQCIKPDTTGSLTVTYNQPNGAGNGVGATLTNAGANVAFSADGVLANVADRILIYNQANAVQNGVYVVSSIGSSNVWTRATDLDANSELLPQLSIEVGYGTTNANKNFRIKLPNPRTITNTL